MCDPCVICAKSYLFANNAHIFNVIGLYDPNVTPVSICGKYVIFPAGERDEKEVEKRGGTVGKKKTEEGGLKGAKSIKGEH